MNSTVRVAQNPFNLRQDNLEHGYGVARDERLLG